jgi:sugar fermentation stimulation protein A
MQFSPHLKPGRLLKRVKRFMAEILLDSGEEIIAHCANTGAMTGLTNPGVRVWVSLHSGTTRKFPYTWQMAEEEGIWVGTDTSIPEKVFRESFEKNQLVDFQGYTELKGQVTVGSSRLDFHAKGMQKECYIEVKNAHLKRGHTAVFPDTITTRGTRHLQALTALVQEKGIRAACVHVIQRQDCHDFRIAGDIDLDYAKAFEKARHYGVECFAYRCLVSPQEIIIEKSIPVLEPSYA